MLYAGVKKEVPAKGVVKDAGTKRKRFLVKDNDEANNDSDVKDDYVPKKSTKM